MLKLHYFVLFFLLCSWSFSAEAQRKNKKAKTSENQVGISKSIGKSLIGTWEFVSGTAQATGGAESSDAAFAERLANRMHKSSTRTFNADGTYQREALDLEGKTFVRTGTWLLQDNTLTMTETHADGTQLSKDNVLVWHRVTINGETLTVFMPYEQSEGKSGKIEVRSIFMKE